MYRPIFATTSSAGTCCRCSAGTTAGSYAVTEDVRGLVMNRGGVLPDIQSQEEGAYTAFQVATIQFKDSKTLTASLALGSQQAYAVEIVGVPLISSLQTTMSSYDYRSRTADTLVKAPVPCFVQLTMTIHQSAEDTAIDVADMQAALAHVVNTIGFTGQLYASQLTEVVGTYLTGASVAGGIEMLGRIRQPDNTDYYLRSGELLQIPNNPGLMVTAKTVQFFLDVADISVNVATDVPLPA